MANKQIRDFTEKAILDGNDEIVIQDALFVTKKTKISTILNGNAIVVIRKLADFPASVGGVITLENKDYLIEGTIDLLGSRLNSTQICSIQGMSAETSILKSTGLAIGDYLVSTTKTMPLKNITLTSGTAKCLYVDSAGTGAYDFESVNFVNCSTIGIIKNIDNMIMFNCALLSSNGLQFDGTINTIAVDTCFFSTNVSNLITVKSTCTIARRLRVIFSSVFVATATNFMAIENTASIPNDQLIILRCNFSGPGTPFSGVTSSNNISDWVDNKGISNSKTLGKCSMTGNVTATVVAATSTFYKALGTTIANALNQRFSHTNNRLTYTGTVTKIFSINAVLSVSAGNNQMIAVRIAKNGVTITSSQSSTTTSGTGASENINSQEVIELVANDYIEVFIANDTAATNITTKSLSLFIQG
jgi:hypothetical protein